MRAGSYVVEVSDFTPYRIDPLSSDVTLAVGEVRDDIEFVGTRTVVGTWDLVEYDGVAVPSPESGYLSYVLELRADGSWYGRFRIWSDEEFRLERGSYEASESEVTVYDEFGEAASGTLDGDRITFPDPEDGDAVFQLRDASQGPVLHAEPSIILLEAGFGGPLSAPDSMAVVNVGGGSMAWTASADQPWVELETTSGSSAGEADWIVVRADPTGLDMGTYEATVTLTAATAEGSPGAVGIRLDVGPPATLGLFGAGTGSGHVTSGEDPTPRVDCTVTYGDSGACADETAFEFAPGTLVTVTATADEASTFVRWEQNHEGAPWPGCDSPDPCTFAVDGTNLLYARFALDVVGTWDMDSNDGFPVPSALSGVEFSTLELRANGAWANRTLVWASETDPELDEGTYTVTDSLISFATESGVSDGVIRDGQVIITDPDDGTLSFWEKRATPQGPVLHVQPPALVFEAVLGGVSPPPDSVAVRNAGGGTLGWSAGVSEPWVILEPAAGASDGEVDWVRVTVDPAGLASGEHTAALTVEAPGADDGSPYAIHLALDVTGGVGLGVYGAGDGSGRVTSDGAVFPVVDCFVTAGDAGACESPTAFLYPTGASVTLSGSADAGSGFVGWEASDGTPWPGCGTPDPCTVSMTEDRDVHARFVEADASQFLDIRPAFVEASAQAATTVTVRVHVSDSEGFALAGVPVVIENVGGCFDWDDPYVPSSRALAYSDGTGWAAATGNGCVSTPSSSNDPRFRAWLAGRSAAFTPRRMVIDDLLSAATEISVVGDPDQTYACGDDTVPLSVIVTEAGSPVTDAPVYWLFASHFADRTGGDGRSTWGVAAACFDWSVIARIHTTSGIKSVTFTGTISEGAGQHPHGRPAPPRTGSPAPNRRGGS